MLRRPASNSAGGRSRTAPSVESDASVRVQAPARSALRTHDATRASEAFTWSCELRARPAKTDTVQSLVAFTSKLQHPALQEDALSLYA